jgi:serine/threonine-protein kinase
MPVAIKVLHPGFSSRPELMIRFRREAEMLASIDHPNIVKILDFQSAPGRPPFLVMELLRGSTLASVIEQREPFTEHRVAFIASQILSALAAAHRAKVIHRDLKPDNVFLMTISGLGDIVKLLDFGIAKTFAPVDEKNLTQTGIVVGTPAYMAPEYARGGVSDPLCDIYGVGCLMYEALAGKPAFAAVNYHALLFEIQHADAEPLERVRSDVSPALAEIVTKAMAKDPDTRFQTANEMAAALEPWILRQAVISQRSPITSPITLAPTELASEIPIPRDSERK